MQELHLSSFIISQVYVREGIPSLHSLPSCITASFPFPECWITAAHLGRANARHTHTIFSATVFGFCPSSLRLCPVFIGLRDYWTFLFRHTEHACQVGFHYSQSLVKPGLLTVEFGWIFCTFCAKTVCQQQLSIYLKVLKKEQRLLLRQQLFLMCCFSNFCEKMCFQLNSCNEHKVKQPTANLIC